MSEEVSLDAAQIAEDYNFIKEKTGCSDEMAIQLLYQLQEARKATLAPIERILNWPVQN